MEISAYSNRVSVMINDRNPHLLWDFSSSEASSIQLIKTRLTSYQRTTRILKFNQIQLLVWIQL